MNLRYWLLLGLILLATAGSAPVFLAAAPDEAPEDPPALTVYKGRTIAQTMHFSGAEWLTRPSRQKEENSALLLKTLNAQPGQVICDLGCGNGYYTLKLAKAVGPEGKILAVDIQKEMLDLLKVEMDKEKVANIQLILGTLSDPKLEAGSCDMILLVDVYHEFSHPEHLLKAMHKALTPNGRVALVEFRSEDSNVPIKAEHKMSKEQILKEFIPNGFRLVQEFDGLPWQHLMYFTRDDAPPERKP